MLPRIFPFLLAILTSAVLATRVDRAFERERQGIPGPHVAQDGRVSIELPDLPRFAGRPAALVAHVRGGDAGETLRVRFDGAEVARVDVGARSVKRIDAAVVVSPGRRHHVEIEGTTDSWRVRDIEVANVHGFSRGAFSVFVVPDGLPRTAPLPMWMLMPAGLLLLVFRPRFDWAGRPWARRVHAAGAAIAALILVVVLLGTWLTRFDLILALHTFLLLVAVIYAKPLTDAGLLAVPYVRPHIVKGLGVARARAPHLAVTAFVLACLFQFWAPGYGMTPLIRFGTTFTDTASAAVREARPFVWQGQGYDGQFYAHLAVDPLLAQPATARALDTPGYRAPRVLFPAMAYIVGFGHAPFVLQVYATLNIVSWLALGWLLMRWLPSGGPRHAAAWAGCMLGHGLITSLTRSLVDGPSMLVLALAIVALESGRRGIAAAVLGLGGLGRDTNLLAAPVLFARGAGVWRLTLHGIALVLPLGGWLWYLSQIGIQPADSGATNFAAPLVGYVAEWVASVGSFEFAGFRTLVTSNILSLMALTTQAVVLVARPKPASPWWRLAAAYVLLFVLIGAPVWEGHPTAATRVLMPMTFSFNVLLPRVIQSGWFWPVLVLGNLNVADSIILLMPWLVGSHLY